MTKHELENLTTDELLDLLPDNLHLARNSITDEHDRFRIYNKATEKYVEDGYTKGRDSLIAMLFYISP